MSERDVINPTGVTSVLTEEEIRRAMSKEERRARAVRVLERGIVNDRTTVENLPPHLHGEWVHRDQVDIDRKRALGFWIDDEYAVKRALHSDGTNSSIVGDTVFMVCLKEDKDMIDEVRYEQYIRMHGSPDEKRKLAGQIEEKGFVSQVANIGLPVIEESAISGARKDELVAALSTQDGGDGKKS